MPYDRKRKIVRNIIIRILLKMRQLLDLHTVRHLRKKEGGVRNVKRTALANPFYHLGKDEHSTFFGLELLQELVE